MRTMRTVSGVRRTVSKWRQSGLTVGLVPTMGALHAGHVALFDRCRKLCDRLVVSIFVNPTQFGPQDDLQAYPRDLRRDQAMCQSAGADMVFAPEADAMYPSGFETSVRVGEVGTRWEGESRPGHFDGVATVVLKLLTIVSPDVSVFGQKDYQQSVVIRRLVEDFNLPVRIVIVPTVREADGLALSSRNAYLDPSSREAATGLYRALRLAREEIKKGRVRTQILLGKMKSLVEQNGVFGLDYIGLCDPDTLHPKVKAKPPVVVLIAATCRVPGAAHNRRFIDNIVIR